MTTKDIGEAPSKVPDGGWGWVMVAASFVITAVHSGTTVSSSVVLYADLIEAFDTTTAAVGVLNSALTLTSCAAGMHAYR